jgi:hypothetical protein
VCILFEIEISEQGQEQGKGIQEVMRDSTFDETLNEAEDAPWIVFKAVTLNIHRNLKAEMYESLLAELHAYQVMGCKMSFYIFLQI